MTSVKFLTRKEGKKRLLGGKERHWEASTSLRGTKQSFEKSKDCFVPRNDVASQ